MAGTLFHQNNFLTKCNGWHIYKLFVVGLVQHAPSNKHKKFINSLEFFFALKILFLFSQNIAFILTLSYSHIFTKQTCILDNASSTSLLNLWISPAPCNFWSLLSICSSSVFHDALQVQNRDNSNSLYGLTK